MILATCTHLKLVCRFQHQNARIDREAPGSEATTHPEMLCGSKTHQSTTPTEPETETSFHLEGAALRDTTDSGAIRRQTNQKAEPQTEADLRVVFEWRL